MKTVERRERLTVYLERTDHHGRVPTYAAIVERARELGVAGATVLAGVEGFGRPSRVHRQRALSLSDDVPVIVIVVDSAARIDALLESLGDLVADVTVARHPVEVITYRADRAPRR